MLRKIAMTFVVALLVGSPTFSTSVLARDSAGIGSHGAPGTSTVPKTSKGVRSAEQSDAQVSAQVSGFRGRHHTHGQQDVWGHWGRYYGPMIHAPMI
jgi:hypothetical protein